MNQIPKDPRIKALASEAAGKIKALTVAHQTQIAAVYQQFREQAAIIQGSSADEMGNLSVTPSSPINRKSKGTINHNATN